MIALAEGNPAVDPVLPVRTWRQAFTRADSMLAARGIESARRLVGAGASCRGRHRAKSEDGRTPMGAAGLFNRLPPMDGRNPCCRAIAAPIEGAARGEFGCC